MQKLRFTSELKAMFIGLIIGAAIAAAFFLPSTFAHRQAQHDTEQRVKEIFGEGDGGLILSAYLVNGEYVDNYGCQVNPFVWYGGILPAILPIY